MRTSTLTRSAVAVASLVIGSAALTIAPAMADAPAGVTRQIIVSSADDTYSDATRTLIEKVCGSTDIDDYYPQELRQSGDVAGVLVQAYVDYQQGVEDSGRACTFAALTTTEPFTDLSGTVTISVEQPERGPQDSQAAPLSQSFPLSGEVFVTKPLDNDDYLSASTTAEATGNITKVEQATTSNARVSTPKSTKVKTAALKSYKRSIASAKAKREKSLKKAGDSSSKKAAARKAYSARKKAAKAALHLRWSSDKSTVVTTTVGKTTVTPFSISTSDLDLRASR